MRFFFCHSCGRAKPQSQLQKYRLGFCRIFFSRARGTASKASIAGLCQARSFKNRLRRRPLSSEGNPLSTVSRIFWKQLGYKTLIDAGQQNAESKNANINLISCARVPARRPELRHKRSSRSSCRGCSAICCNPNKGLQETRDCGRLFFSFARPLEMDFFFTVSTKLWNSDLRLDHQVNLVVMPFQAVL